MDLFKKSALGCALLCFAAGLTGCAVLLVGAGATGGYAISQDEISGYFDRSPDAVWKAVTAVIEAEGLIKTSNKELGKIEALVQESDVKVNIQQVTTKSVKLTVESRKNLLPRIKVSQDVYTKVADKLK